ncbi:MAG: sugar phosphate isomerase/epimerase [Kiritimatiellae bacterium]|nr:sugar phosphate isomerase/epimerase [Kiritimatiellia bacterium]
MKSNTRAVLSAMVLVLSVSADEPPIRVAVAAYSFRNATALEAIPKTRAVGADAIEFFLWQKFGGDAPSLVLDHRLPPERAEELLRVLRANELRASNAYFNNAAFRDPSSAEAGVRSLFELAKRLGLEGLTGEPPPGLLDVFERLAKEYDLAVCFHNHPRDPNRPEYRNWDPEYLMTLLEGRDHRMGLCVDTGHLVRSGLDPVAAIRRMKNRIRSVHLKDVVAAEPKARDVRFGEGIGRIREVIAELRALGYRGYVVIEYENLSERVEEDVRHCVEFVRSLLK